MVILDAENDEGWLLDTSDELTQIASNFPSTLVHGGAILDTYLIVMDEEGIIYNSDTDDPTTFGASSFVRAERENDKGVHLAKHHDHVVAFLTRTIEFLYDAGNVSGSPLNRRQDISYNVGCADGLGVWTDNDIIYFVGTNSSGQLAIYKIENFQLKIVSNESLNAFLTESVVLENHRIVLTGLSSESNTIIMATLYELDGSSNINPKVTVGLDTSTGLWGQYNTALNSQTTFPLIAWTRRTGGQNVTTAARTGEGLFANGDILTVKDNFIPIDSFLASGGVYDVGVYDVGLYAAGSSQSDSNIVMSGRTGLQDFGTSGYKFQNKEVATMLSTPSSQTLTIKHSDETSDSFGAGNTIDTSLDRKETHQGGRFMRRNYEFSYSGDEQAYLEDLDIDLMAGM